MGGDIHRRDDRNVDYSHTEILGNEQTTRPGEQQHNGNISKDRLRYGGSKWLIFYLKFTTNDVRVLREIFVDESPDLVVYEEAFYYGWHAFMYEACVAREENERGAEQE